MAEDAAYKDGELFYAQNDYSTAANRFSSYIKAYPRGKYIEAAYYFCCECYLRCKEYELSIINSKNIDTTNNRIFISAKTTGVASDFDLVATNSNGNSLLSVLGLGTSLGSVDASGNINYTETGGT